MLLYLYNSEFISADNKIKRIVHSPMANFCFLRRPKREKSKQRLEKILSIISIIFTDQNSQQKLPNDHWPEVSNQQIVTGVQSKTFIMIPYAVG